MRKLKLTMAFLATGFCLWANNPYKYIIDITTVSDDKVYVELIPPDIKEKKIIFYLPKIIPGTYSVADYGRMVSGLKAFDKKGQPLPVERLDENAWQIKKARKIAKISYWVEDSYDTETKGPTIFQPAGTNIEEGENFVINTAGFFGYFEGKKEVPFELEIIRPSSFYGATGLKHLVEGEEIANDPKRKIDRFRTIDYNELIDSPFMFSKTDTAVIELSNTDVLVASYSPNSIISAREIAASLRELLQAQTEYLGGKLPVEKYSFLFYFTDNPVISFGALEHSYSSMYFMPEGPIDQLRQQLRDIAAHEFFHIVTPLNIHAEQIANFDFNNPEMSEHLWLYEGMTEYSAGHMQVKHGLISPEEYLEKLSDKLILASQFKEDLPFTELSKGALGAHANQYFNVYQKGALIGMAMDIKLRQLSGGTYGTQDMMADLSKRYGKDKPFRDEELFGVIAELTYPDIAEFLTRHVSGKEPIPYQKILELVGVNFQQGTKTKRFSIGIGQSHVTVTEYNGEQKLAIANAEALDPMGKLLGLQNGDILYKMNGELIPSLDKLQAFMGAQIQNQPQLQTFSYTVIREVDGEQKQVVLSAPNKEIEISSPLALSFVPDATEAQINLRKAWLEPSR